MALHVCTHAWQGGTHVRCCCACLFMLVLAHSLCMCMLSSLQHDVQAEGCAARVSLHAGSLPVWVTLLLPAKVSWLAGGTCRVAYCWPLQHCIWSAVIAGNAVPGGVNCLKFTIHTLHYPAACCARIVGLSLLAGMPAVPYCQQYCSGTTQSMQMLHRYVAARLSCLRVHPAICLLSTEAGLKCCSQLSAKF
ncbi:hypothetical protein COO60DRAFT_386937 [Scenedesmus sp. NREL 46B-D3]|nr:hypothetical protein COO60DRAFT_386937 [Scenedesmus sp. NREL 46B-D3]